jgi:hypothetical protein
VDRRQQVSGETGYDEQGSLTKLAARDRAQLIVIAYESGS